MDNPSSTPTDFAPAPADRSGCHPINLTHLIMGITFLGFAGIWALLAGDVVPTEDLRWLLPVPWLAAGSAGLLAITAGRVRGTRSHGDVGAIGDDSAHTGGQKEHDLGGQVSEP